jgi:hypothetical protein
MKRKDMAGLRKEHKLKKLMIIGRFDWLRILSSGRLLL